MSLVLVAAAKNIKNVAWVKVMPVNIELREHED